ncbi:MAG: DUF192 domain-containing protein [Firmicutes bacterium]|nr:DUF192 domain-containing protein [Bacillota bacterium]
MRARARVAGGGEIVLAERVALARGFVASARGLLGVSALPTRDMDAMALVPCVQVHTRGMAFAIDVLMLSPSGRVVAAHESVAPGRSLPAAFGATWALELPAGTVAGRKVLHVRLER